MYHFFENISLDKQKIQPLYLQLVDEIVKGIQLNILKHQDKLPGTRDLSRILNLNRNTIVRSFEELENQGWIQILPNIGTYILAKQERNNISAKSDVQFHSFNNFQFKCSPLLDVEQLPEDYSFQIDEGFNDTRIAEFKLPAKIYALLLKDNFQHHQKSNYFKRHLINYLNSTRNLNISPENLLIVKSSELALQIVSKTIFSENELVAVEELSYYKSNMILQSNKAKIIQVKSDEFGMDIEHLRQLCETNLIKAVYLSPISNYPNTNILSNDRKLLLKELSIQYGFAIIEEDQNFDYVYERSYRPLSSINTEGNCIYISEIGKELAPGFQMSFVVAPSNFIQEAKKHLIINDSPFDPLILKTLGTLIKEGDYHRILKRHRKIYRQKRDDFSNRLILTFGNKITVKLPKNGFAVWIEWNEKINLMQLKKDAFKNRLFIPQHLLYQTKDLIGIRIGFGSLNEEEMDNIISILKHCLDLQNKKAT